MAEAIKINRQRLMTRLDELSKIGKNAAQGIDRQLGSIPDEEARAWLTRCWQHELGLTVKTDGIANLWGQQAEKSGNRPIVLGSHHDTVPNGGKYDGALGVLLGTEVLQTLQENQVELKHPLWLISFTGEEPNDFSVSTLGSKVLAGRLTAADVKKMKHRKTGEALPDALQRLGGDIQQVDGARLAMNELAAFLECHIEQGRVLYDEQHAVAAVSCITGIYREVITISGEANHAGTTKLKDRRDALVAAAEVVLAAEAIMKVPEFAGVAVTIGRLTLTPNASNIIPGKVVMTFDLRTADAKIRQQALALWQEKLGEISNRRSVSIEREVNLDQPERRMDDMVIEAFEEAATGNGQEPEVLVSMAGHDAANMARVTKAGMLFVQTVNGYSHCPQEEAAADAIEIAANTMLAAVRILDRRLDAYDR